MIPFSKNSLIHVLDNNVKTRIEHYKKFCKFKGKVLDIGERNVVIEHLYPGAESTQESDFNKAVRTRQKEYDVITCFEVIEHIMNPLSFLEILRTKGKKLYLSTPKLPRISWYQFNEHFTEYKETPFERMLEWAGWKVVKREIFCPYPLKVMFTGIRPVFRLLFHRTMLYELE